MKFLLLQLGAAWVLCKGYFCGIARAMQRLRTIVGFFTTRKDTQGGYSFLCTTTSSCSWSCEDQHCVPLPACDPGVESSGTFERAKLQDFIVSLFPAAPG